MLQMMHTTVYNKSPTKEILWKKLECAQFARLKRPTVVFTKARKGKMAMQNNVKFVDWLKDENIIKNVQKYVLLNMKDGLKEIQTRLSKIKELITTVIKKESWIRLEKQEKKMDTQIQKPIAKEIRKKLIVTILSHLRLNLVNWLDLNFAKDVKTNVSLMLIMKIIQSPWMLFGFVVVVMEQSIGLIYQRERLNLWTPKGDAIVQTTEETCRGEFEAVPPPRNWSVSKLLLKVIEWLRHTAGCSFYQGSCITNDLWVQNLRSTGI